MIKKILIIVALVLFTTNVFAQDISSFLQSILKQEEASMNIKKELISEFPEDDQIALIVLDQCLDHPGFVSAFIRGSSLPHPFTFFDVVAYYKAFRDGFKDGVFIIEDVEITKNDFYGFLDFVEIKSRKYFTGVENLALVFKLRAITLYELYQSIYKKKKEEALKPVEVFFK